MTLFQSPIQFADYIMPPGTILKTQQLDSTIEEIPLLGIDGSYAPPGYAKATIITLEIEMGGGGDISPTTSSQMITLDDVNNEANQLYSRLKSGPQKLIIGTTPARYIMAQKSKWKVEPLPGSGRTHFNMQIEFYAQDPRWLAVATSSQNYSGTNPSATLVNSGTARAYPVFTITAGTNPKPVITLPWGGGGNQIAIQINYTFNSGDTLVIDCDPRNRWKGITLTTLATPTTTRFDLISQIINNFGTADTFPFLDPGSSLVQIDASSSVTATVTWQNAYGL